MKKEDAKESDQEDMPESLFSWDFLDDKEQPPKVEVKPADIQMQKEVQKEKVHFDQTDKKPEASSNNVKP